MYNKITGEILWMVMLLLVLLGLGMIYLSNQQMQVIRANQWHDVSIRMDHETDKILSYFARSTVLLSSAYTPMGGINDWPSASLSTWQRADTVYHQTTAWGGEVHLAIEIALNNQSVYRLNALGYHPSGTLLKKQWVVRCEEGLCRRLSCIML